MEPPSSTIAACKLAAAMRLPTHLPRSPRQRSSGGTSAGEARRPHSWPSGRLWVPQVTLPASLTRRLMGGTLLRVLPPVSQHSAAPATTTRCRLFCIYSVRPSFAFCFIRFCVAFVQHLPTQNHLQLPDSPPSHLSPSGMGGGSVGMDGAQSNQINSLQYNSSKNS